ncbi:hypothetical protein LJ656_24910 [Paraburkholderia sp. MMS20-SJTR3]|uniref:Uncharacterized protein n=1 Tax=Paraburkholderia sejongensis TaxID=2886946 RepID=A0ABS8K104_9BURK|nr:tetratricopeptide repeat-containing protein [Paraburkholderia sp. MMS20-SJTR3]MCC8395830.1 hypothetical protein [Paraburkholderia sp. MMS20-SJTR3]
MSPAGTSSSKATAAKYGSWPRRYLPKPTRPKLSVVSSLLPPHNPPHTPPPFIKFALMSSTWELPHEASLAVCANFHVGPETLLDELKKLARLHLAGLPDAVAFYAGRIVEGLASAALQIHHLYAGSTVIESLDTLALSGKVSDGALLCGHAIRRLANEARHLERSVLVDEEATIVALLQLWVEWFVSACGASTASQSFSWNDWSSRTPMLRTLAAGSQPEMVALSTHEDQLQPLLADSATAAFVAERLVDCNAATADRFTRAAKDRFPHNRRITQIRALHFSRAQNPEQAIRLLLPLRNGNPRRLDIETIGILGGAYKTRWLQSRISAHLKCAYDTYTLPVADAPRSHYLQINIAATALWMDKAALARSHAQAAIDLLAEQKITSDEALEGTVNYWMVATLAEAQLLVGNDWLASVLYAKASATDNPTGPWARTAAQLRVHLEFLPKTRYWETMHALVSR